MDQRVIKEAVDWYVRMHDGPPSAVTRTQFTEWLLSSPDHIRAFLEVTQSIRSLNDASRDWDREKLVASALKDRDTSNVVALDGLTNASPRAVAHKAPPSPRLVWIVGIACGALAAGVLCGWLVCDYWHHTTKVTSQRS